MAEWGTPRTMVADLLNGTQTHGSQAPAGQKHEAKYVVQMVITVLIFIVGIPLNGLVVWVLGLRHVRRHKGAEGRGAGNFRFYVVNLALADLVLLMRTPLMLGYLAHHGAWPFGLAACRLVMYLRGLGLYANAFLLCAISVERCLCLLRPVWFRMSRARWAVPLICLVLWVLASALAAPYLVTATVINGTQCWETDSNSSISVSGLFIAESILGFLLPLFIFLSSNIAVLITAQQAGETVSSGSVSSGANSQRFTRLVRVLFLTMLLFLSCWVPYFTCRFLVQLKIPVYTGVYVALYLVYVKSALNPLLYVFATQGLRRTIRASLISTVDRIFNDDTSDYSRRRSLRRQDSQF